MPRTVQIYRATVDPGDAERLLAVRGPAIAALQRVCPQLLRADLIRLDIQTWLDVLVWSDPTAAEAVMEHVAVPAAVEMHALVKEVRAVDTGELAHTTQP